MRPGPAPKPTALKALQGNPGRRKLNESEPKPAKPKVQPYAPKELNEYGKLEWRRIIKLLSDLNLYTDLDHAALVLYCQAWGQWLEAEEKLRQTGGAILTSSEGNLYQNPWGFIANKAWEQMRKILGEFGMTPSSRSRIRMPDKPVEDPFEEFVRRKLEDMPE